MTMNAILLFLYAAAGVAYAVQFARRTFGTSRIATVLLVFATFAHTFVIGMETMRVGHVPFASATSAISMFVWLLALSYLYVELTTTERAMGVFILPLLVVLQTIPAFSAGAAEPRSVILESPWFGVHVSSLLFAYASFALAAVLGITYVLQFKEIKAKALGFFYERLPSLNVLDEMNLRAVKIGWLFLTVGLITGAIWASQLPPSGDLERVDVDGRSEDLRRGAVLGRVFVRALRPTSHRVARPARGAAVGDRLRHRAAELRARELLFHDEPQLLACNCSWSASAIAPPRSSFENGSTSRPVVSIAR